MLRDLFAETIPYLRRSIIVKYYEILTTPLVTHDSHPINFSHFNPCTQFKKQASTQTDLGNRDTYWLDSPRTTRLKHLALIVGTPIIQSIGALLNLANRIAKVITCLHFWHPSLAGKSLSQRAWSCSKDSLRIAFTPIILVGLELSALYGLLLPNQGKKLYATFERCLYGRAVLAPCFQPSASEHLLGGKAGKPDEW